MKRFRILIAAAASIAALASGGCAVLDGGSPKTCPSTAILDDAGELVRFASTPPQGPNDISFSTRMKFISGVCDSDEDEIVMELNTWMEAVRGPANAKGEFSFVYFVAILGSDKKVLTRVKFPMVARFHPDSLLDSAASQGRRRRR